MAKAKSKRTIKIFYAWQSDLPSKFNRSAIKNGLTAVASELGELFTEQMGRPVDIVIDEATRDLPGSPHIPTAILKKIQEADIFVADVTTINAAQVEESKKTPNPNVVFELGHAVAHLGWERVLLLVNEVHGPVKALPFDFDRQRASAFKFGDGGVGSKNELAKLLSVAVSLIIQKDPPRPTASKFDVDKAKRDRDLTNLRWVLSSINWPTIDEHISASAKYLSGASVYFYDIVHEIVWSSSFHLYDKHLAAAVTEFIKQWHNSMKFDHYTPMIGSRSYIFTHTHGPNAVREMKDREYMDQAKDKLRKAKDVLLARVREQYPEIDLQELSNAAGRNYNRHLEEIQEFQAGLGRRLSSSSKEKGSKPKKPRKKK